MLSQMYPVQLIHFFLFKNTADQKTLIVFFLILFLSDLLYKMCMECQEDKVQSC